MAAIESRTPPTRRRAARARTHRLLAGATVLGLVGALLVPGTPSGAAPSTGRAPSGPAAGQATGPAATPSGPRVAVRVDQLGYVDDAPKYAFVLSAAPLTRPRLAVVDARGRTVATVVATRRGRWSAAYPDVYQADLGAVRRHGRYRLVLLGSTAVSPSFPVASARTLWAPVLAKGVAFDQLQRDGAAVRPRPAAAGTIRRAPSHRDDARAGVYHWPRFTAPDTDEIADADLRAYPGEHVDAEGGWFDAGDYLKFTHSTAYADVLLYAAAAQAPADRIGRARRAALLAEARHGTRWLRQMWDGRRGVLAFQVGIGSGNAAGTFTGDHDLWRLPQADDHDTAHADRYSAAHRPVFVANRPGQRISPNLAGRTAAALAMAARADARRHPARARAELAEATAIYRLADTAGYEQHPHRQLVTALPWAFYPETVWRDDMELGAVEIAQARRALGRPTGGYLDQAAHWAAGYLVHDRGDTLNLYDDSALAHVELVRATRGRSALRTIDARVTADLAAQLSGAARRSAADPFRAGVDGTQFDVDSHTLGLVATAGWYHRLTGSHRFDALAASLQAWVFGANAWGVSFMVGVGTTFPRCLQHQVANLAGRLDGRPPLPVGAVVNGPNGADLFSDGLDGFQDGMRHCPGTGAVPAVRAGVFDGSGSVFLDDVRSWQTDEPALDMTGAAIIAAAVQSS
ncbi:hypothetical protein FHX74_001789 [Friedmanniella endophytica]|uniref:N-terminal ig-like domain of cellulase n=1 Tax=Microlunatus kandeliicorticis TaxID=1759536 RepID=A0A7W3IS04_9ACTN|nr:glycoside hydrolase family 9 protein [Microlunatus kandeliicorticis]MBA8794184.1 hypothetical protein [Microlunatus kandeliicorticis]